MMPAPATGYPMMPPPRGRRTGRRILILVIVLLAILGLLFGLDRAAAAYAAGRIASKLQADGFPVKPHVSIEGFPFLTQVIGHHLDGIAVTAAKLPAGPVTARSIDVQASDITLDSGYQSGTIARVTGTGLISFASLATIPALAALPGLKITGDGPHRVKLQILTASAIARVKLAGPGEIALRLVSASGLPVSLPSSIRHLVVPIPKLPLGLVVRSVTVGAQGVVIGVAGSNVGFGK